VAEIHELFKRWKPPHAIVDEVSGQATFRRVIDFYAVAFLLPRTLAFFLPGPARLTDGRGRVAGKYE